MYAKSLYLRLEIKPNDPVIWGVAVCAWAGMSFCKAPVAGRAFGVMMKLSGLRKAIN